jgi:hypothetical protein
MACGVILLVALLPAASAQYPGWRHSGSLLILTTPEGANLPATASEEDFPLLVRLNRDWFDFQQAKPNGEDVRFATGAGCHFDLADFERMGLSMAPLVEHDIYGRIFDQPVTAPDLQQACYTTDKKDEIALEFDQPMSWDDELASQFHLDAQQGKVTAGAASGNVVKLKLAAPDTAKTITYLVDRRWDPKNLLCGQNGIAALTF